MVKLHRTLHSGLEWCVDRAELAIPSTKVLFESHRDQRTESEHSHVKFLARIPDEVKQIALILGSNPDLIAQVSCVCHA